MVVTKAKPARGKGYSAGASFMTSILMNDVEEKVNFHTGSFCTCVGEYYLQSIFPEWKSHPLPIEAIKFIISSSNMYAFGILDTNIVFPHPEGSVRMKTEIVVMENCISQHIIWENNYLNIYGIDINNQKDRYFTIGENKRNKFAFSNIPKQISIISSNKDTYREEFSAFSSDNESSGTIKGHEVDITLNIERLYPPVSKRPAYTAVPRARKGLEKHIQEFIQLGKVGHDEEFKVTTPVIISWNNDKSRMVGDFRALNTYTVPDRYPIHRIQKALTQLSKAKYIISIDALKGFHENVLTDKDRKLLRIIAYCGINEYLRMPFSIKNAPSTYQRMMNIIFPTGLSEGWHIIHIDYIIIC
ncbi:hypothetical protein O181_058172 [Austropuccinia psidii MF-1]|uniref:Reverse transcriptase domain-containing protein n=1 Tax=Austropuccinia psidii MF-1 TaxID=1389203 RepID=A0A9Q3HW63_9BASI|nr:hypothetical protein [Austropuccinia psidii MF-1]